MIVINEKTAKNLRNWTRPIGQSIHDFSPRMKVTEVFIWLVVDIILFWIWHQSQGSPNINKDWTNAGVSQGTDNSHLLNG